MVPSYSLPQPTIHHVPSGIVTFLPSSSGHRWDIGSELGPDGDVLLADAEDDGVEKNGVEDDDTYGVENATLDGVEDGALSKEL